MGCKFKIGNRVASADRPKHVKKIVAIMPDGNCRCEWLEKGKIQHGDYSSTDLKFVSRYLSHWVIERLRL